MLKGEDSLRNHKKRSKGRPGADANSSVARNASRVKEDGPGAAGSSINNANGCKKKREQKRAAKVAAALSGSGDMGGSPITIEKEERPDGRRGL